MTEYYLAVDIGASSGRHILGWLDEQGMLNTREVYRFPNGLTQKNGHLCWDIPRLFDEILAGIKACKEQGVSPAYLGIDTWAVDFVLLDEKDNILGDTVGYRDSRTQGMDKAVYERIPEEALYARTGIQKQPFNTIYQLQAVCRQTPELCKQAKTMLMIPDYFHFLLTGKKAAEYTNATTTQLVSPVTKDWDWELIDKLGYPREWFCPIKTPGTRLGDLRPELQKELGLNLQVILPPTHDTASAVLAVPSPGEQPLYISSGTWSLMGTEREEADCSEQSRQNNFTSEGGMGYRFRYLKNIMGLWMIQSVRRELAPEESFGALCEKAKACGEFPSRVDANDGQFLAPESMAGAVKDYCEESGQPVPQSVGEILSVIYHSLAECYGKAAKELEAVTGKTYPAIHIVGGGCKDDYLNELTGKVTGKPVLAGPKEATAIGNIIGQMLGNGVFADIDAARETVKKSVQIEIFD